MKKAASIILLILFMLSGFDRPIRAQESSSYWPTKAWRTSSPEQQGMDSELLTNAVHFLLEQDQYDIHSLLVIRSGYIVTDVSFYPFQAGELHDLASVTKSFTSTLIGLAIQQGFFSGVDQRVLDFFPNRTIANLDTDKRAITVEDLLTMRSGLACGIAPGERELLFMLTTTDWIQYVLDLPMVAAPGTERAYCSPGTHLLQGVIAQSTGMSTSDFTSQYLFEPLGISEVIWPVDGQGINHGWGDLRLMPRDMAKLGLLYLRHGNWDGNQLLPDGWGVTAVYAPPDDYWKYGYLWWIGPDYYLAMGRGGQFIYLFPEQNLIVVLTGNGGEDRYGTVVETLLRDYILPAAVSRIPLLDNPDGVSRLDKAVQRAAETPPVEPAPVPPLPPLAEKISGQTYNLAPNLLGLTSFSLSFRDKDTALVELSITGTTFSWLVGLDQVERLGPGRFDMLAAARGEWTSNDTFLMHVDEIGNNMKWIIRTTFDHDDVVIVVENKSGVFPLPISITGSVE